MFTYSERLMVGTKLFKGPYKSALIAAPRRLLRRDMLIVKLEKFTIQNVSFYGRNRRAPQ